MWSITPECEKSLDRYEGYPNFYHKTDVAVTDPETGKIYHVMMYEMDEKYREPYSQTESGIQVRRQLF